MSDIIELPVPSIEEAAALAAAFRAARARWRALTLARLRREAANDNADIWWR